MDEFGLIEQFKPGPATSVAEVLARAAAMPDRDELVQAAADRAAADARAERREAEAMLNRMAGDPLGNISRCQAAVSEARDRVTDLENQLEEARGRLSRAAESLAHWSGAAEEVHRASIQRSDPGDLLAPAKQALAEERVERMLAAVRARPAGRPKGEVSRSRGAVAARSESCQWCIDQNVSDHDSCLLHSDPEYNVPVTTPEQAQQQAEHAERRGYRVYGGVSR
jgi:hypothetical protein